MNDITLSQFLTIAISLITFIGLIGKQFFDHGRSSRLQEEIKDKNEEQDGQLGKLWSWKDNHEQEANEKRLRFEIELASTRGELKGIKESQDGQFEAIMDRLTRVEGKIDRLEERIQD